MPSKVELMISNVLHDGPCISVAVTFCHGRIQREYFFGYTCLIRHYREVWVSAKRSLGPNPGISHTQQRTLDHVHVTATQLLDSTPITGVSFSHLASQ